MRIHTLCLSRVGLTSILMAIIQLRKVLAAGASQRRAIILSPALVPIISAVAGILVYFSYNGIVFGGILPVSGATKRAWSQFNWERKGGYSFTQNFWEVLQMPVFDIELLVALNVCACLLLVWWLARRSRNEQDWLLLAFLVGVFGLAAGHLAKFAQTVLTVSPSFGSYAWYFVPAYLMIALNVPVNCYVAIYFIRRFIGPKWHRTANLLSVGIVVAGAAFLLTKADFAKPFRYVEWRSESTSRTWMVSSYMGTQVMDRVLPENSVVGSWSAGVIGYFSRLTVVNLDGLVNDYDYLRARKEGVKPTFKTFNQEYGVIHSHHYGITHFADIRHSNWSLVPTLFEVQPTTDSQRLRLFNVSSTEQPGTSSDGIDRAAWFWERMEPHFDYQSDGVGLIVDGRLAHAFAKDCTQDELAVWVWARPEDEMVASAWTNTQTGLCVAALVLPRNAAPPVRVATMPVSHYLAALVGDRSPEIRSNFDVHLFDYRLIYVKEQCGEDDVAAWFFLHLDPVDANDLPPHRKQYGFDNLDFNFDRRGVRAGSICWTEVPLPDYDITEIRTGQYIRGESRVWEGRFALVRQMDDGNAAP